jgi:hypothetical protein
MLLNPSSSSINSVWYQQQQVLNSFNFCTNQGFNVWNDMNPIPIVGFLKKKPDKEI